MQNKSLGKIFEHTDVGAFCLGDPVIKERGGQFFTWLFPYLPQVFFHIIRSGKGLIDPQSFLKPLPLGVVLDEVFMSLEQQPAGSLLEPSSGGVLLLPSGYPF